jgi:hypothetical protein
MLPAQHGVPRGAGLTLTPTYVVGADIKAGRLQAVLSEYQALEHSIYAVYPQRRHLSPKVRAFVEFMTARISDAPYWDRDQAYTPRGARRLHIGLCLFSRVGQTGDAPGLTAAAEQALHGAAVQVPGTADLRHRRQRTIGQAMLAQIVDDGPVVRGQRAYAVLAGHLLRHPPVPAMWIQQETVRIGRGRRRTTPFGYTQLLAFHAFHSIVV